MAPSLQTGTLVPPPSRWRYWRPISWSLLAGGLCCLEWMQFSGADGDRQGSAQPAALYTPETAELAIGSTGEGRGRNAEATILTVSASGPLTSATASGPADSDVLPGNAGDSGTEPPDGDERFQNLIAGRWEDEYRGKRRLTVKGDGTGTMVVEPEGIGKKLFAAQLTFDLEWTLSDGKVTLKMLRGEPKSKVNLIIKLYGREAEYKILKMTSERMLLLDPDGKTEYDWRRPSAVATKE